MLAVVQLWKFGLSSGAIEDRGEEGEPWNARADDGLLALCLADEHFIEGWLGGFETEGRSTGSVQIGIDEQNTLAEVDKRTSQIYCDCSFSRSSLVNCHDNFFHDMIEYGEIGKRSSTDTKTYR